MEAVKEISGLAYQEVPQQRRCSFYATNEDVVRAVGNAAANLGCDFIYSAGKFLDILPKDVNKGSTLIKLIKYLNADTDSVLVAGDTLNDFEMYKCGFKGVAVRNSEPKLLEAVSCLPEAYVAKKEGAGGILEAIKHFDQLLKEDLEFDEDPTHVDNDDTPQLIMMYHRFPYENKKINGVIERTLPQSPNGILPTLQNYFSNGRSGVWIAWEEVEKSGELLRNLYIDKAKYANLMASRIGLTKKEIDVFYKSFAKEAFWPTIFSFIDKAKFNHHHWDHFVQINRLFAVKAAEQSDQQAIVWIHDYNLWLVPGLLREMRPDLKIGFFHHTAFPAANTFNILPWRREIIGSLLQCDYIGFHIPRYVENFVDVVKSLFPVKVLETINCAPRFLTYSTALGVQKMTTAVRTDQRVVRMGANPVGINVQHIKQVMESPGKLDEINNLRQQFGTKKIILSVERLDYVKGALEKILAFEQFLNSYPEFHGKVELIQICSPAARGMKIYDKTQHDVEHAIGRINGNYSSIDWIPIRLLSKSYPFDEIISYYAVADIAWITPLRDGLNLVAKEYVAVQGQLADSAGTLILSEFAGSAVELHYAIPTNPYDTRSLKESLLHALTLEVEERKVRMQRLYQQVVHYDINFWAEDFMLNLSTPLSEDKLSGSMTDRKEDGRNEFTSFKRHEKKQSVSPQIVSPN
jgi:glucosylglycerol-phosphate synthase